MLTCSKCGEDKPEDHFNKKNSKQCKGCRWAAQKIRYDQNPEKFRQREYARRKAMGDNVYNEYQKAYRAQNPEKHAAWAKQKNLERFGLTIDTFYELLASQGNACAICKASKPGGRGDWHVDHDHACCGKDKGCDNCVRGLLCFKCNLALGYLNDNPELLKTAIIYLERRK